MFCMQIIHIHDHQYIQRTTNAYKEKILFLKGLLFNKIQYQHDQSESEVNMASLRAAASPTTRSFFWKYDLQFFNQKGKTLPVQ